MLSVIGISIPCVEIFPVNFIVFTLLHFSALPMASSCFFNISSTFCAFTVCAPAASIMAASIDSFNAFILYVFYDWLQNNGNRCLKYVFT